MNIFLSMACTLSARYAVLDPACKLEALRPSVPLTLGAGVASHGPDELEACLDGVHLRGGVLRCVRPFPSFLMMLVSFPHQVDGEILRLPRRWRGALAERGDTARRDKCALPRTRRRSRSGAGEVRQAREEGDALRPDIRDLFTDERDRTRSMSWIMRSRTTSTSVDLPVKGLILRASMNRGLRTRGRACLSAGFSLSRWPTWRTSPRAPPCRRLPQASSGSTVMGFSCENMDALFETGSRWRSGTEPCGDDGAGRVGQDIGIMGEGGDHVFPGIFTGETVIDIHNPADADVLRRSKACRDGCGPCGRDR